MKRSVPRALECLALTADLVFQNGVSVSIFTSLACLQTPPYR